MNLLTFNMYGCPATGLFTFAEPDEPPSEPSMNIIRIIMIPLLLK